jgi:hypothetical protein
MRTWNSIREGGRQRTSDRGQVLPLFALMIVVLFGMAALAIDVSRKYADVRFDRSSADAASLAGAQDLQTSGSRTVTGGQQDAARRDALETLIKQLGASGPGSCAAGGPITDCPLPGTPYRVSINTPAPSCTGGGTSICDSKHSVQVTLHNTTFDTTFARILGQSTWDVGATSVAGLTWSARYSLVTLQAPAPRNNGTDTNIDKDLIVNGTNTVLHILNGDIGTNTSATTTNSGLITIDDGFIDHYDDLSLVGDTWTKLDGVHPIGNKINSKIQDPNYMKASFTGAPTFADQTAVGATTACSGANFPTDAATILRLTPAAGGVLTCYQPGIYTSKFTAAIKDVAYLMPGAYSFPGGVLVRGTLAGGLISNQPGVVLVVPQTQVLDANSAENFLINSGADTCSSDACRASAAVDFALAPVKTPQGLIISLEVLDRDSDCFVGTDPVDENLYSACTVAQNNTVGLAGGGKLAISGVIYGPSDNMNINGGGLQTGTFGQIVSWSIKYTGGATLNQSYPRVLGNGILRIDPACSAPSEPCVSSGGERVVW